ncbi:MAG TPA: hypothetical protein VF809_03680 [Candidatus Saccharimonadales bacterium]
MHSIYRRLFLCLIVVTLGLFVAQSIVGQQAEALSLLDRSLRIENSDPGAITRHTFQYSYATTGQPVGSLMFEYCTSPLEAIACEAPSGMNAGGAVLTSQTGETGYFVLAAQTNRIVLTRAPALPPTVNPSQYVFDHIVNPDGSHPTFYVRITTHLSTDASDANLDFGAVVNATTTGLTISGEVPPILNFCVGLTIGSDCSSASGNLIDLGDLSTSHASSGTSQMMTATNAEFGLAIGVYGTTMTSGNNVIPSLAVPTPSAPGNAQFGMNLRANSNPAVGTDPTGGGVATPTASYGISDRYAFNSGDIVVVSATATDTRKFTTSYVVNISPSQSPGVYTATLTYICTATF